MSLVSKEIDHLSIKRGAVNRGVVQMARALAWGARGRTFESCHPDHSRRDSPKVLIHRRYQRDTSYASNFS